MRREPVMVFAGEFWPGSSGRGLADGFRTVGWAVQEVDSRGYGVNPGRNTGMRLAARAFRKHAAHTYRQKILENCRALKPDIFLTIKGVGVTADLLRQVRESGTRTVMYYPDVHFDHPGIQANSFEEYDLFVTTKTFQLDHLERLLGRDRVAFVPHGYSDEIHRALYRDTLETDYEFDLQHVGAASPYKVDILKQVRSAYPQASLRIVGDRWDRHARKSGLIDCVEHESQFGYAYSRLLQTARVNVAIHFGATTSGWEDKVSTRTFEIPACRGFMLHIDNDEVRELFTPGDEIDLFSTAEELADKIRFYLPRPELRARMIERAYARCVPAYGYAARARQIVDILVSRANGLFV